MAGSFRFKGKEIDYANHHTFFHRGHGAALRIHELLHNGQNRQWARCDGWRALNAAAFLEGRPPWRPMERLATRVDGTAPVPPEKLLSISPGAGICPIRRGRDKTTRAAP